MGALGEAMFLSTWGGGGVGHGQINYTLPKVDITKAYVTTALLGHRITVSEEKGPELNECHLISPLSEFTRSSAYVTQMD